MLGRLIKQHSLSNLTLAPVTPAAPKTQNPTLAGSCNYDDSYMRDILYALRSVTHGAVAFDPRRFRLVVGQDGGNLRAKQILYDVDHDKPSRNSSGPALLLQLPLLPVGPSTSELADYMFGRGIPTNEVATATKVHVLYLAQGPPAVLVTKLFLLVDKCAEPDDGHPDWTPTPTWPATDTVYGLQLPGRALSCRFSLGVVIPLDDQAVEDVLATVWPVVARHLTLLQKIVARKLVVALRLATVDGVCPYVSHRRIAFPPQLLHHDADLALHTVKLARAVQFTFNTPRLMDTHTLMHSASTARSPFRFFLISWAAEVVNWLEFKDGRTPGAPRLDQTSFLANLITAVLLLRDQMELQQRRPARKEKAVTRVVVMTGNSAVAKRLVFILNGFFRREGLEAHRLLADTTDANELRALSEPRTPSEQRTPSELRVPTRALFSLKHSSPHRFKSLMDDDELRDHRPPAATPIPIRSNSPVLRGPSTRDSSLSLLRPIPIGAHPASVLRATASLSGSIPQPIGWEIPTKSGASLWASSSGVLHAAVHTSSSTACLSTSLNSLSSSASNLSNYSLSKLGGSFVEKWKQLFATHDDTDQSKRTSLASLKTPPALEDEPWDFSGARQRLSRTQSMLILTDKLPPHSVRRDNTAVYADALSAHHIWPHAVPDSVPDAVPEGVSLDDVRSVLSEDHRPELVAHINQERIRRKCASIMESAVTATASTELNAVVVPDGRQPGLVRRTLLLPNVAFVDEFRPEFVLQSCPVNAKLESSVVSYMKNDLVFSQSCGYEKVTSRTVFVNLRAREAKLIELGTEPTAGDLADAKAPHTSFRTSIKKVVAPGRNMVDRTVVERIGAQLRQLTEIVDSINNGGEGVGQSEKDPYNQMLFQTVLELIR